MTKTINEKRKNALTLELVKLVVTLKQLKQISPILFEAVMANVYDGEQQNPNEVKHE